MTHHTDEQTTTLEHPDVDAGVEAFVAAVRSHLRDLPVEEQQELTEGLAADLTEQVADGTATLGDPAAYAGELRVAAGFPVASRRRRFDRGVDGALDDTGAWWHRRVAQLPGDVDGLLVALRPAWWVLRGWGAFALVLVVLGHDGDIAMVPTPGGNWLLGVLGLLVAVVGSVQVGRGRLWPGTPRRTSARVVLLALNVLALVVVPAVIGSTTVTWSRAEQIYGGGYSEPTPGLAVDGNPVTNLYPYDAQGHPLVGVQLLDQTGRPVGVDYPGAEMELWQDGDGILDNVFPMPERRVDPDTGDVSGPPRILSPVRSLQPVSIKGFVASLLTTPTTPAKGTSPSATPSASPGAGTR